MNFTNYKSSTFTKAWRSGQVSKAILKEQFDEIWRRDLERTKLARSKGQMKIGILNDNYEKNRYIDVFPLDENRVVCNNEGPPNDYINASWIRYKSSSSKLSIPAIHTRKIIASQGCLANTIIDFWSMIYTHEVSSIIMLTPEFEGSSRKVSRYWIEDGEKETTKNFGDFSVSKLSSKNVTLSSSTVPIYKRTTYSITKKEGSSQKVDLFQFYNWHDDMVPELSAFMKLLNDIREESSSKKSPMLVHCTAGVGRTGTFILCYLLSFHFEQITKDSKFSIFEWVDWMRGERVMSVQSQMQYNFVHEVIALLLDKIN